MLTSDQEKLKEAALAATPGPWTRGFAGGVFRTGANAHAVCSGSLNGTWCCNHDVDERFIAAANPAAILAILAQLEQVQGDARRFRWLAERFTGYDFYWGGDPSAESKDDQGKVVIVFEVGESFQGGKDFAAAIDVQERQKTAGAAENCRSLPPPPEAA